MWLGKERGPLPSPKIPAALPNTPSLSWPHPKGMLVRTTWPGPVAASRATLSVASSPNVKDPSP